ncbi:hypothetical protein EsH8_X_000566 [Colletotrichum jinshuiense]
MLQPGRVWLVRGHLQQQPETATTLNRFLGPLQSRAATEQTRGWPWTKISDKMNRLSLLLLLLCGLVALASANSAPTFCKCTCFKNSTIVALGPQRADQTPAARLRDTAHAPDGGEIRRRAASSSCSQCTKAFCLSRGIDFCRDATEEDVQTMCFQRDSNKDRVIVWGFLLGTAGLLGWAAVKRVNELREGKRAAEAARSGAGRGDYSPLTTPTTR